MSEKIKKTAVEYCRGRVYAASMEILCASTDLYAQMQTDTNIGYMRFLQDLSYILAYTSTCASSEEKAMLDFDVDHLEDQLKNAIDKLKRSEIIR